MKDNIGAPSSGYTAPVPARSNRLLMSLVALALVEALAPAASEPQARRAYPLPSAGLCGPVVPGVNCGPGKNRRSFGGRGAGKVPHNDGLNKQSPATRSWPALSGILWQVLENSKTPRTKGGGPLNDELLGHHGTDRLSGKGGNDIIWGDWDPQNNNTTQRDVLDGGPGDDWLYPSHGKSIVRGGPGTDYVWAYYGKGTINCGPGIDTARIRTTGAFRTKGCEKIRHFCAHGENRQGQCLSPSGKPVAASRRRS